MPIDQNEIAAYVDEKVQRTMAVFALRRIRAMIDQEAADEIATGRLTTAFLLIAAAFLAVPMLMFCIWALGAYL